MYTLRVDNPDKLFFTSDTHFNHFNIVKYCHRPFESREDMNNALIENWNNVVPKDGIVVHCGDFTLMHYKENNPSDNEKCLKEYLKIMKKLNGQILLIRGNHDVIQTTLTSHDNLIAVVDKANIIVDDVKIYADHYPSLAYAANYQVFGHIHTLSDGTCYGLDEDVNHRLRKTQYDVGVDQNGYKPISYWQLCDIFREKQENGYEHSM